MRRHALRVLAAVAALGACQPGREVEDARRGAITAEVTAAIEDLYAAMNAHDPDRVLGHYLQSDAFLYVGVSDSMQGWDMFATLARPWYLSHGDVTFEHEILHVQVLAPDVATVTARGGSSEAPSLMWTRTLVLRDGVWLVALEHESWPGADPPNRRHPMG
jgi:uncharacterized protein (TIGR02246 family)